MARWLFKQEPSCYSYDDLERDGMTVWDGVANALALQNLRKAQAGEQVFFYHTGKEKAIVGVMEIIKDASALQTSAAPKSAMVSVKPIKRLARPVTLALIKGDQTLSDWDLVRLPRLSVLPVSAAQWKKIEDLATQV